VGLVIDNGIISREVIRMQVSSHLMSTLAFEFRMYLLPKNPLVQCLKVLLFM
jgi:hypothetical protein